VEGCPRIQQQVHGSTDRLVEEAEETLDCFVDLATESIKQECMTHMANLVVKPSAAEKNHPWKVISEAHSFDALDTMKVCHFLVSVATLPAGPLHEKRHRDIKDAAGCTNGLQIGLWDSGEQQSVEPATATADC